jgi:hypothetical protein
MLDDARGEVQASLRLHRAARLGPAGWRFGAHGRRPRSLRHERLLRRPGTHSRPFERDRRLPTAWRENGTRRSRSPLSASERRARSRMCPFVEKHNSAAHGALLVTQETARPTDPTDGASSMTAVAVTPFVCVSGGRARQSGARCRLRHGATAANGVATGITRATALLTSRSPVAWSLIARRVMTFDGSPRRHLRHAAAPSRIDDELQRAHRSAIERGDVSRVIRQLMQRQPTSLGGQNRVLGTADLLRGL